MELINKTYSFSKEDRYQKLAIEDSLKAPFGNEFPEYAPPNGALFTNITTGKLYVSLAGQWVEVGPSSSPLGPQNILSFGSTNFTNSTEYTTLARWIFAGTDNQSLSLIKLLAYMTYGATSFDLLVVDVTNNVTISSALTQTNITPNQIISLVPGSLPATEAIFEVWLKRNGGDFTNKIYLNEIQLYN